MSAQTEGSDEPADEPTLLVRAYRTVTPTYRSRPDVEMDVVGWGLFVGLLFLLVPFLPVIVAVWLISKVVERVAPTR